MEGSVAIYDFLSHFIYLYWSICPGEIMIQQPSGYLVMTQVFTTKYYDLKWHKTTLTIPIWKIWHWYEMWQIRMTFFYYWQIDKTTWSRKCASACYLLHNMKDKKESFVILNQNQYLKADHITCMTLPVESSTRVEKCLVVCIIEDLFRIQ